VRALAPGGAASDVVFDETNVVVLPVIRIEPVRTGPIYVVPTLAEQAHAVGELIGVMRDTIVPKLPLLDFCDAEKLIDRLTAAAATLRRLAGEGGA
jgi:hypothetical protein